MGRHKFEGDTPDGKRVTNVNVYLAEWNALKVPLERGLNLRTIGFDPGFRMHDADGARGCVDIPVWLARRIVAVLPAET